MYRRLAIGLLSFTTVGFMAVRAASLPVRELPAAAPESSAEPLPSRRRVNRDPVQRGVALGLFAEDVSFSYAPLLDEIAALGASHVALVVPLYQTHTASTQLYLHTRLSPTLEAIADAIRDARRASGCARATATAKARPCPS
jgi:hypothetical protein